MLRDGRGTSRSREFRAGRRIAAWRARCCLIESTTLTVVTCCRGLRRGANAPVVARKPGMHGANDGVDVGMRGRESVVRAIRPQSAPRDRPDGALICGTGRPVTRSSASTTSCTEKPCPALK